VIIQLPHDEAYKELTLDDIETALDILEHYLKLSRRVEVVLRRFQRQIRYSSGNIFDVNSIVQAVLQQKQGMAQPQIEENIGELSPEEVKRMKEIVEKVRKKK